MSVRETIKGQIVGALRGAKFHIATPEDYWLLSLAAILTFSVKTFHSIHLSPQSQVKKLLRYA